MPKEARTVFQSMDYLERERAELAKIDEQVFEGPRTFIQDLFNPGSDRYVSDFDLKSLLGDPSTQHSIWDIGAGPKGRHLKELSNDPKYSRHSFFGISPWMHKDAPHQPYNGAPPLMMPGIVQALDTSVLQNALRNKAKSPDIILARNTLRHVLKRGSEEFELARGFEAMNNVLPIGGKIL